jgi:nuclear transcription Y subunit beta
MPVYNEGEVEIDEDDFKCAAVREQDRFLPIANISRIMKKALPANAKIAKDAKETVQECVSEFISFITSEASDKCQREKRKTINGEDLLWSMSTLGFEEYVEPLKVYLLKYREVEKLFITIALFIVFLFYRQKEIKHIWRNRIKERKKLEVKFSVCFQIIIKNPFKN